MPKEEKDYKTNDNLIIGRNAVIELLKSGWEVENVLISKGEREGSINRIVAMCKENKIVVKTVDRKKLDFMCAGANHQGVVANVPAHSFSSVEVILEYAKRKGDAAFIIICDEIEDSHNLGAIIRSAEACGAHGVIIPKRRAVSVNSTVNKASAGAVEHMKIARVTNISDAIEELKKAGLWVCGTAVDTNKYYYNQDLTGPIGIVIGNEGSGMSDKVRKNCDFLVKIPMKGKVQSLNASVSTGIVVYEAVKQRIRKEN